MWIQMERNWHMLHSTSKTVQKTWSTTLHKLTLSEAQQLDSPKTTVGPWCWGCPWAGKKYCTKQSASPQIMVSSNFSPRTPCITTSNECSTAKYSSFDKPQHTLHTHTPACTHACTHTHMHAHMQNTCTHEHTCACILNGAFTKMYTHTHSSI